MVNTIKNLSAEEIYNLLDSEEKDSLYRLLWSDYVREDVKGFLDNMKNLEDITLTDEQEMEIVERVVNDYVYNGDYDCSISYWDNIKNLVDECIEDGEKGE